MLNLQRNRNCGKQPLWTAILSWTRDRLLKGTPGGCICLYLHPCVILCSCFTYWIEFWQQQFALSLSLESPVIKWQPLLSGVNIQLSEDLSCFFCLFVFWGGVLAWHISFSCVCEYFSFFNLRSGSHDGVTSEQQSSSPKPQPPSPSRWWC